MLIRIGQTRRSGNPEEGWDKPPDREPLSAVVWWVLGGLLAAVAILVLMLRGGGVDRAEDRHQSIVPADELREVLEAAAAVARAFLAADDPQERLKWVRDAGEVRSRVSEYPDEARMIPGEIDKLIGHGGSDGSPVTAFAVAMPSGEMRLLEVVGTPEGPRVDWDAYARHGTASWEDLWSGKSERAVVRVFCEPATEHPSPFEDREAWTTFRMSSPDLPQVALGFTKTGTVREEMMKKVVLGTPRYRQRFVLEVLRREGEKEPLFEITRCLAVGWIMSGDAVEDDWEKGR